jgi:hypothetical protein
MSYKTAGSGYAGDTQSYAGEFTFLSRAAHLNQVIQYAIFEEAQKLVERHQKYASYLAASLARVEKRSGILPPKDLKLPAYWSAHSGFNPYHVRAHADTIAYAIDKALRTKTYEPRPAVEYEVPKKDGGVRKVSVFPVADNALSRLTFLRLMEKNARHLSSNAYAYRTDLGIHDAILHISSDFRGRSRIFIAEFDFRKYFDSISHEHIRRVLRDRRFFLTDREQRIIESFLISPSLKVSNYDIDTLETRDKGVPQGTSISLFLANVAAYPLDRRLERLGVGFARYADDTLIWADSYAAICEAANSLEETASEMGVDINFLKSEGISILSPSGLRTEMNSKSSVDFVGYAISSDKISIRSDALAKTKKHLSYLIYSNLLQWPKKGVCLKERIDGGVDWDYVVMLNQVRRYLYGEMSEAQLRKYLARQTPRIKYHGLMSFYPVISDENQLKELDGWLLNSVYRALKLRSSLYSKQGFSHLPLPHSLTKSELLGLKTIVISNKTWDLRFPSVARISKLIRRAANVYGPSAIANPRSHKWNSS